MFVDDWRCAGAYVGLGDLPPPALAWEFLRRNQDYQADYQRHVEEVALGAGAGAEAHRFARWGLTFRRRSGDQRPEPAHLLAA